MSKTQLAFIAGFFQGEGSTACYRNGNHVKLQVTITQRDISSWDSKYEDRVIAVFPLTAVERWEIK